MIDLGQLGAHVADYWWAPALVIISVILSRTQGFIRWGVTKSKPDRRYRPFRQS
jgi:hypothetical protein